MIDVNQDLRQGMKTERAASAPRYSIVSTMYRSAGFIPAFLSQCLEALRAIHCEDFEIVLVNDGSPDESLDVALAARAQIPSLVVVDLSRNFGHHAAMLAGLGAARGERVFLIDCDLEVSPGVLVELDAKLNETKADMVYGYQEARKGGRFEKLSGGLFYKGFNLLSDTHIPENVATERVMTRPYVEALLRMGDKNLFLAGMMSWAGFKQIGIVVKKKQRDGRSTYTLRRKLSLLINAVASFSAKPLMWLFTGGLCVTGLSLAYVVYLIARKIFFDDALLGFTSVMALTALSLGVTTTGLGLIGIYLGKVFSQVQNRPTYIVRGIHGRD